MSEFLKALAEKLKKTPTPENYLTTDLKLREDVANLISHIGKKQREFQQIEAEMNEEIGQIVEKYATKALPCKKVILSLTQAVTQWCESRKAELTNDGEKKSVDFVTGEIRWRKNPDKVSIVNEPEVVGQLQARELWQFIRTPVLEVNKDVVKQYPHLLADIEGIKIMRGKDKLVVIPLETKLEAAV